MVVVTLKSLLATYHLQRRYGQCQVKSQTKYSLLCRALIEAAFCRRDVREDKVLCQSNNLCQTVYAAPGGVGIGQNWRHSWCSLLLLHEFIPLADCSAEECPSHHTNNHTIHGLKCMAS
jgi:hypothetical protein